MDKCREEFEAKWADVMKGDDDTRRVPTRSAINPDEYAGGAAQFAWKWWKASRESMKDIRLPVLPITMPIDYRIGFSDAVNRCKDAITSAGYKVE